MGVPDPEKTQKDLATQCASKLNRAVRPDMAVERVHYFVDMVFYHRVLKCHVLVELKMGTFSHENIGQLSFELDGKKLLVYGENGSGKSSKYKQNQASAQ